MMRCFEGMGIFVTEYSFRDDESTYYRRGVAEMFYSSTTTYFPVTYLYILNWLEHASYGPMIFKPSYVNFSNGFVQPQKRQSISI